MKFDCKLPTVNFLPIIADFRSTDQVIEQKCDPRLET